MSGPIGPLRAISLTAGRHCTSFSPSAKYAKTSASGRWIRTVCSASGMVVSDAAGGNLPAFTASVGEIGERRRAERVDQRDDERPAHLGAVDLSCRPAGEIDQGGNLQHRLDDGSDDDEPPGPGESGPPISSSSRFHDAPAPPPTQAPPDPCISTGGT